MQADTVTKFGSRWYRAAPCLLLGAAGACAGQGIAASTQLTVIEATAARHMLSTYPPARITVDSAYTTADAAPGVPTGRYRPSARTAALAAALQARVGSEVKDDGMRLRLSEPRVFGDTARITVTLHWGPQAGETRGQSGYHTRGFTVIREREAWRVAEVRELGIT